MLPADPGANADTSRTALRSNKAPLAANKYEVCAKRSGPRQPNVAQLVEEQVLAEQELAAAREARAALVQKRETPGAAAPGEEEGGGDGDGDGGGEVEEEDEQWEAQAGYLDHQNDTDEEEEEEEEEE